MAVAETRNLFSIGRRIHDEDQLTEMLAWLVSAVPEVGGAVIRLALPGAQPDLAALDAKTQQIIAAGRLDAVVTTDETIVVVESKLQSAYGQDQLSRYLDWLATDHRAPDNRCLMTLTEQQAPWPGPDVLHAEDVGVKWSARRWEDLYVALDESTLEPMPDVSQRLVQEFRDMLNEEGLVPMKPLEGDELVDAWSRSNVMIGRYHEYFRACQDSVAKALSAKPHSNRSSAAPGYIYQDFETLSGEFIAVGLSADRGDPTKPRAPMAWLSLDARSWPNWQTVMPRLEAAPPEGWALNARWWGRPCVWRYLHEIIGDGTFEDQRSRFAAACSAARGWLESARDASAQPIVG